MFPQRLFPNHVCNISVTVEENLDNHRDPVISMDFNSSTWKTVAEILFSLAGKCLLTYVKYWGFSTSVATAPTWTKLHYDYLSPTG